MIYRENGQFKTTYRSDSQIFPILQDRIAVALFLIFAFAVVPMLASDYLFRAILIPFLIISLAALGVNILVGYCGQISLGSGAFMAVGAYGAYNFFCAHTGHAADTHHHPGRYLRHAVWHFIWPAELAGQRPVSGRHHAGGTVLFRLDVFAHQVVYQRLAFRFSIGFKPASVWHAH